MSWCFPQRRIRVKVLVLGPLWILSSERDSDCGFEWRNDADKWFPKSQSLLHHQHSNAHPPLPQKSIFNLSDHTSLHAPLPLPLLKHSFCISPALKENRPGILLDSKGSPHYKLVGQLFVSSIVQSNSDWALNATGCGFAYRLIISHYAMFGALWVIGILFRLSLLIYTLHILYRLHFSRKSSVFQLAVEAPRG